MPDQTPPGSADDHVELLRARVDVGPAQRVTSKRFDELSTWELYDVLRLRCDVFVVEQACAYHELDGRDTEPGTTHHWIAEATAAADRPVVVAYLRTLTEPDGSTRVGRVATASTARGRGLAAMLVEHVGDVATGPMLLDAQSHLTAWYVRLGYAVDGAEFVDDGIPHVPMRRPPRGS